MDFNSILNFVIPAAVIIFLIVAIFSKIKVPLLTFWNWLRMLFGAGADKIKEMPDQMDIRSGNITYR